MARGCRTCARSRTSTPSDPVQVKLSGDQGHVLVIVCQPRQRLECCVRGPSGHYSGSPARSDVPGRSGWRSSPADQDRR